MNAEEESYGSYYGNCNVGMFWLLLAVEWMKAYRAGTAKGTSLPFILLIITGYLAGIFAKIVNGQMNYVLIAYVARIEHFAVGVEQEIYDRKIVYELSNGFLNKVIRARVDIVLDVKEQVGKGGHYAYIRWLYEWMEKEEKRRARREELLKNPLYKGGYYFLKVGRKILKI